MASTLGIVEDNAAVESPTLSNWDPENNGGKQPNFLQKLYNFLALDPHPCPEVIYWAADSRQLVIAQPDRLVREVLPKLFKHDKLTSFGRQLNIYGFSRLFPGRQFKDADGNVSDASVWAHPTLHRCSTSSEIGDVKRRAAPKLFRTRRLANGQMIRTRAGPAVEARAREIRESIAESRRNRVSISYSESMEGEIQPSPSPSTQTRPLAVQHAPPALGVTSIRSPLRNSLTFADSASRLPDITEGVVATHPPTPVFHRTYDGSSRRDSVMFIDQSPTRGYDQSLEAPTSADDSVMAQPGARHAMFHQIALQQNEMTLPETVNQAPVIRDTPTQAPSTTRPFQSCPASIHTSPIQAHMLLNSLTSNSLTTEYPVQSGADHAQFKIAVPAAPYPFTRQAPSQNHSNTALAISNQSAHQDSVTMYPLSPSSGEPSNVHSFANTPVQAQPGQVFPSSVESTLHHAQPSWTNTMTGNSDSIFVDITHTHRMSWEAHQMPLSPPGTGTIDPRWVSPMSSAWNSLAPTRLNSPLIEQSPGSFSRGSVDMDVNGQEAQSGVQSLIPYPSSFQDDLRGNLHPSQFLQAQQMVEHDHYPHLVHHDSLTLQNQLETSTLPQLPLHGTQSYPPRQVERRQMDISPPLPLIPHTSGYSVHKTEGDIGYFGTPQMHSAIDPHMAANHMSLPAQTGPTLSDANHTGANSLPVQSSSGIGGGKWYL